MAPFLIAFSESGQTEVYLFGICLVFFLLTVLFFFQKKKAQEWKAEQLRKQIAEDFHDELGSRLTIISMYSELIKREMKEDNPMAKHYLDKIIYASNGLYLAMKDMLWALDPAQDKLDNLLLKIKDFAEELFEDSETSFSMNGIEPSFQEIYLPIEYKRHLLLLIKEGLHNILRHAYASEVSFQASVQNNLLTIVLKDNGNGFAPTDIQEGEGLKNMKSRAEKLNGTFQLSSSENGTLIQISCPLR